MKSNIEQYGLSEADMQKIRKRIDEFERYKQELLCKKDYFSYLMCFDSHNCLKPFLEILHLLKDREYWELLRIVYESDDFWKRAQFEGDYLIMNHRKKLFELLASSRPGRDYFMEDEERRQFDELPPSITVFRGFNMVEFSDGYSWSTSMQVAIWFAQRFKGDMIVAGRCSKKSVIGYLLGREEFEIVIDPKLVTGKKIQRIE